MKFPVIVKLAKPGPLWEPRSGQNFWKLGDVSAPLHEGADLSSITKLVSKGKLVVVAGSLSEDEVIDEPSSTNNEPDTEKDTQVEPQKPKKVGGGWYELPDGNKVRGYDSAMKAIKKQGLE